MKAVLRFIIRLAEAACLALAVALLALACVECSSAAVIALGVTPLAMRITAALPSALALWGVMPSPLGGVFRTDFLIVAVALLVVAGILRRCAKAVGR